MDLYNMNGKSSTKATGADSKFFTTNRKGENHELREELRSQQRDRRRDAVKKVIDELASYISSTKIRQICVIFMLSILLISCS